MRGLAPSASALRLRLIAPAVVGLAGVALVAWLVVDRICSTGADDVARAAARGASETYLTLVRASTEELSATLGSLSRDDELTAAVAERDARRILAIAGPRFHELRLRHDITHWNYWELEPPGPAPRALRNIVRLGTPTLRGDPVERETLALVAREKAVVSGLELGYTGFVVRVLAPVRQGERIVGYAELGRDIGQLLDEMRRRSGDDFALVLDKRLIDPRRWAVARSSRGERDDWEDREDVIVARASGGAEALLPGSLSPERLREGETALGVREERDRAYARGAFTLTDAGGHKVGAIYVFRDVTALVARAHEARRRGFVALAGAVLAFGAALALAFERLVVRRAIDRDQAH